VVGEEEAGVERVGGRGVGARMLRLRKSREVGREWNTCTKINVGSKCWETRLGHALD